MTPTAGATRVQLNLPRPARVRVNGEGVPLQVDGSRIELVRESWLVEDRWWTAQPLRRRYWELVTVSGRNVVVFHDLGGAPTAEPLVGPDGRAGGWFSQRA